MNKKIISLIIVSCLLFSSTVYADVESYELGVDIVEQEKSKWCWAACAEMAGDWAYEGSDRTQYDVVKHVKGSFFKPYPNVAGSLSDGVDGSEYVTYDTKDFSYVNNTWSIDTIRYEIINNFEPIQASAGYYDSSGKRTGGHRVVINGVYTKDFGNAFGHKIHYIDLWDGTEHWVLYDDFCDGTYNGRIYDGTLYEM